MTERILTEETKELNRVRTRAWHEQNELQSKEYKLYWYEQNKEKVRAQARARYQRLKDDPNFKRKQKHIQLASKYGISIDEYEAMCAAQADRCAICGKEELRLCVDHDHSKEKGDQDYIRGLLCKQCNSALGLLYEDPKIIRNLCKYLGMDI